jgi:uncharacterized membrane protein
VTDGPPAAGRTQERARAPGTGEPRPPRYARRVADPDPAEETQTAQAAAERLTFFSDAVVAIAITLLAIDLPLPTGETNAQVLESLWENNFDYLAFFISFLVIGTHWITHHRVFRHVVRADGPIVVLNLGWLMLIVLTPWLTRVLSDDDTNFVRFGLYALAQTLQLLLFSLMVALLGRRGGFAPGSPPSLTTHGYRPSLVATSGFVVSIPLYPLIGSWGFLLWALVPNVIGRVARRVSGDQDW